MVEAFVLLAFYLAGCTVAGPCGLYETEIQGLSDLTRVHQDAIMNIFNPCEGDGDPRMFVLKPEERDRKLGPEDSRCYSAAEYAFADAVSDVLLSPERGRILVEIVHEGWVLARYELASDGTARHHWGEPSYGHSLEVTRGSGRDDARGRGMVDCGGVFVDVQGGTRLIAVPIFDGDSTSQIGEVQLLILESPSVPGETELTK